MLTLKGSEAAARIKQEVQEMTGRLGGYVPTAAIVRVGERPDDLSYERNVMKKITSFGMEARSFSFPETISEEEFREEFRGSMRIRLLTGSCCSARCHAI